MKTLAIISNQAFSLINFRGDLIKALVRSGASVYALAPDYDRLTREQVMQLGAVPVAYALSRTGMNPLKDFCDALSLTKTLRSLRPDTTLCYFIKPVIYGTLAAWLAKVPRRVAMIEGLGFVFTLSKKSNSLNKRFLKFFVSFLYRIALKKAHYVIFLNKDDLQEFVASNLVESYKCKLIPGIGVDLEKWCAEAPVTYPVTFTLAARLLHEKGVREYIDAARIVKYKCATARFILLGDVDANPGSLSREEVESWVSEGLIEWPGHVRVKYWLEQTSVYVLPSYREGVPRSTQEALAMARPVITTDVPGCRETVIDGENGFLIPARNFVVLAEKMLIFINKPSLIGSMGEKSRALAEKRFDVHKINKIFLAVLDGG